MKNALNDRFSIITVKNLQITKAQSQKRRKKKKEKNIDAFYYKIIKPQTMFGIKFLCFITCFARN